ncbi:MAG TPA: hypothetical protein VHB47_16085 [Thermoanaerobaculia bacterium]|jgi:hypothetical protein|nr:hypothetical protein [Thermoanaerobaculia bacterium]
MKIRTKRIALQRDTLRQLDVPLLGKVAAGTAVTGISLCATCNSCHLDCTFRVTCTA